jgi:transposase-like protein
MERTIKKYSEALKQEVIRQVKNGLMSKEQAKRHYHILGKSAVLNWLRNYEKYGVCSLALRSYSMSSKQTNKPENSVSAQQQAQRIKELERQLEDAQLLNEMYDRMINIAEREYKIPIRKKPDTK